VGWRKGWGKKGSKLKIKEEEGIVLTKIMRYGKMENCVNIHGESF